MKLILHIGTDKTGSTAVQKHLYVNHQWLQDRGVLVPKTGLGKDNGHGNLLEDMSAENLSCLLEELRTAEENGLHSAILSWEGMCFFETRKIQRLTETLRPHKLWLLVYLREQADIIQTGYLQELKNGKGKATIIDFRRPSWSPLSIRALPYCYTAMRNYAQLLERWTRFIPKTHVIAREFQRELLVNQNVVDDVLSVLNQTPDDTFAHIHGTSNISLDVESAIIMNDFDRQAESELSRKVMAFSLLSLIHSNGYGSKYFLSERKVKSIRRYYRRSNKALNSFSGSKGGHFFLKSTACVNDVPDQIIHDGVEQKRKSLAALMCVPMLFPTKFPHETPMAEILVSGWLKPEETGVWSSGDKSRIRFRVPFWMTSHEKGSIAIFLRGQYAGGSVQSQITVNGIDFGWIDLRSFDRSILLAVSKFHRNEIVELQIAHELLNEPADKLTPASGISDRDGAALRLEDFGIQFVNP